MLKAIIKRSKYLNEKSAVKSDPTDNIVLECAFEVKADYIISGDEHLLNLKEYNSIKIVTPKEFLRLMEKK